MHRASPTGGEARIVTEAVWKPHATVAALCERDGKFLLVREKADGLVVYKVWSGTPRIDEYRDRNNPLGPLQGAGGEVVRPIINY